MIWGGGDGVYHSYTDFFLREQTGVNAGPQ